MDPTDSDIFVETQQKRIDELRATLEATERERDALRAIHTQVQDVLDTTGLPAPDIVSGVKELRNRYDELRTENAELRLRLEAVEPADEEPAPGQFSWFAEGLKGLAQTHEEETRNFRLPDEAHGFRLPDERPRPSTAPLAGRKEG